MNTVVASAQTHFFRFKPVNNGDGVYEYCMNSKLLFNPEDNGMGVFQSVIAGLEPEDDDRIQVRCFSDAIIGEIYLLCAVDDSLPEEVKIRNKKALEVAEQFVQDMQLRGFTKEIIEIKEGDSPTTQMLGGYGHPINWK